MKRRQRLDPADLPPLELLTFTPADWAAAAPAFDERVDHRSSCATESERRSIRAYYAWCDARLSWIAAYGWSSDSVDEVRDRVQVLLGVVA